MANKRQLKKYVYAVCGDIATELLIARSIFGGYDNNKVNEIINDIAMLQESTISNISFSFDKQPKDFDNRHAYNVAAKKYHNQAFAKLIAEFNQSVEKIVKMMNEATPADVRKALKEAAE